MRKLWEKTLNQRYSHIEYKGYKRNRRQKRRRNMCVKAKRIWTRYWRESIPIGYEIHHCDRNIYHNKISNLALVTTEFHDTLHGDRRKKNRGKK